MAEQWISNFESNIRRGRLEADIQRSKKQCYIKRVDKKTRELNEDCYTPQLVSIGPYHHGREHLVAMEPYKYEAVSYYLARVNKSLSEVTAAMMGIVDELMEAYHELDEKWNNKERFLELIIVDGCFLLECFLLDHLKTLNATFFGNNYLQLRADLLMIENQIPLSAIAVLIELGWTKDKDTTEFIRLYESITDLTTITIRDLGEHHLDLTRKNFILTGDYFYDDSIIVRPASELIQAGVEIIMNGTHSVKNISFDNGTLSLPSFNVSHISKTLILNYIAYELIQKEDMAFLNYVKFMYDLIHTVDDVKLLRKKNIIIGHGASNSDVVNLFIHLAMIIHPAIVIHHEMVIHSAFSFQSGDYSSYQIARNVNHELNVYCNKRRNRWRASFMQSYLDNPWVFFSLLGALILLLLTLVQTAYSVLSYYKAS